MRTDTELSRKLGIETPIVPGPFGGGYSTARLAAVSESGGLGSFGVPHPAPVAILSMTSRERSRVEG